MSNYSSFFPSGGGGGGETSTPGNRLNRRIFYGPIDSPTASTITWPVPDSTTSVEVHVWGGGGGSVPTGPLNGAPSALGGGGGGGYARAEYIVASGDSIDITVGGIAGSSSLTIPTQSPQSPISATGGSNTTTQTGGSGGTGSVTLNPTFPTGYCMNASGGSGSNGTYGQPPGWCNICWGSFATGGGGAAGSPLGPGCNAGTSCACNCRYGGGGGGIGSAGSYGKGGGSLADNTLVCFAAGAGGLRNVNQNTIANYENRRQTATRANCDEDIWWKVEDIKGAGGLGWGCKGSVNQNNMVQMGGKGAGGGGGGASFGVNPSGVFDGNNFNSSQGARGGIFGGGGGNVAHCRDCPTNTAGNGVLINWGCCDGKGGAAGGSGGGQSGTPGVVIIYW